MENRAPQTEQRRLKSVATEYRRKGYEVEVEPTSEHLPPKLADYRPDLIAVSAGDKVVVEVKSRRSLASKPNIAAIAKEVESIEGWRFELVMTNPRDSLILPLHHEVPDSVVVQRRLGDARRLAERDSLEAAALLAWSALEGALRMVAQGEGIELKSFSPGSVGKEVFAQGLLSREDYSRIEKGRPIRNLLIHGFSGKAPTRRQVFDLLAVATKLVEKAEAV